jgi:DNA-binding XRE family transcriptional regulator
MTKPNGSRQSKRISELEAELRRVKRLNRTRREPGVGIGGVIQRRREELGMTLTDLGNRAEVSKGLLSGMEQGIRSNPTLKILLALAKALDTTASELLQGV